MRTLAHRLFYRGLHLLGAKNRKWRNAPIRFFLFAIVLCGMYLFCRDVTFDAQSAPLTGMPGPLMLPATFIGHIVKPGETFASICSEYAIPQSRAAEMHNSIKPLGFSHLKPGDSLVLTLRNNGLVSHLAVLSNLSDWYKMTFSGSFITARKDPLPTSIHTSFARAVISNSLSESLGDIDVGSSIVAQVADIFAWDINFFIDPQPGDTVEVLFTQEYIGDVASSKSTVLAAHYVTAQKSFWGFGLGDSANHLFYYNRDGQSLQKEFLKAPLRFNHISSRFTLHRLHPVLGIVRPHLGIDYAAPSGTPVYAAADGIIAFAGWEGGFGKYISMRHGGSYETTYGHLSAFGKGICSGMRVRQGDCIGYVGSTGMSTGAHLDYRMKSNGRFINPTTLTLPPRDGISEAQRPAFDKVRSDALAIMKNRFTNKLGCFAIDISTSEKPIRTTDNIPTRGLHNGS